MAKQLISEILGGYGRGLLMSDTIQRKSSVHRYWTVPVASILLVAIPAIYGLVMAPGYALADPFDHFGLAISNLLPLVFPLLATGIFAISFSEDVRSGYCLLEQIRIGRRPYVLRHCRTGAFVGATAGFMTIAVWWVITMVVAPRVGWVNYYPEGGAPPPPERFTWSQLMGTSPIVFFVAYSSMVALHAALYSVMGDLLTIILSNRLLALAAPIVGSFVLNFVFGSLGLGQWGPMSAIFTQGLTQGSFVPPIATTGAMLLLVLVMILRAMSTKRPAVNFQ